MSDNNNININTPEIGPYTQLRPFRFWCQKVLPLVYDESLSYYELLCKVVDYLNKTMEDVDQMIVDMGDFQTAYTDFTTETRDAYIAFSREVSQAVEGLETFVNNYFNNLDVQQEINNKLDAMAQAGYFDTLFTTLFTSDIITEAGNVTSAWIAANLLQETGYVIDNSLTVANAAADAKATGNRLNYQAYELDRVLNVENAVLGAFEKGALDSNGMPYTDQSTHQYRICNSDFVQYEAGTKLYIAEGFEIGVHYYSAALVSSGVYLGNSGWQTDNYTIQNTGPYQKVVIRRIVEDTSEIADIDVFKDKVNFKIVEEVLVNTENISKLTTLTDNALWLPTFYGLADLEESYPSSFNKVLSNNIPVTKPGNKCKVSWIAYPYSGATYLLVLRKEEGYIKVKKTVNVPVVSGNSYEYTFDYDFVGDGTEYIGIVGVRHNVNISGGMYVVYAATYDPSVTQYDIPTSVNRDSMVAYDFTVYTRIDEELKLSEIENINVLLMGDSIFGNDGEIAGYLNDLCNSCVNGAFGGTQVSVRPYTSDAFRFFDGVNIINALCTQTWTDQDAAAASLSATYPWITSRLATLKAVDMSKIDLLIMDWGTNDYTAGATIETINNAYEEVIDQLQETYPQLRILVCTPIWRYWGDPEDDENGDTKVYNVSTLKEIALAIESFMKDKRISVLNAYQNLPLTYNTAETYFDPNDKTHLNAFGNKVYSELIHGKIRSIY